MAWYNSNWKYRVKITVQNGQVDADLTDFPIYVDLSDLPADFHTNVNQTDARDIRVTESDGTTEVPREVVFYDSSTDIGELHFKGDILNASDVDFYIYYGNASATEPSVSDTYGRNNVWTEYVGVWHLQEDPSGTAPQMIDSTGGTDGTSAGSMSSGQSVGVKIGNGINLIGDDDYIDLGDYTALDGASSATFSTWLNYDTFLQNGALIRKYTSGSQAFAFTFRNNGETYGVGVVINDGTNVLVEDSTGASLTDSTDYHLVGVWSGTNNATIYKNGSSVTSTTTTNQSPTSIANVSERLAFGARYNGGSPDLFLDGRMDEVRLATDAKTSTWISTEYNNQNSPDTFYNTGVQEQFVDVSDSITITEDVSVEVSATGPDYKINIAGYTGVRVF